MLPDVLRMLPLDQGSNRPLLKTILDAALMFRPPYMRSAMSGRGLTPQSFWQFLVNCARSHFAGWNMSLTPS